MDDIWSTLSFGVGRRNAEPVEHAVCTPVIRVLTYE
jgi:hypothetical protein